MYLPQVQVSVQYVRHVVGVNLAVVYSRFSIVYKEFFFLHFHVLFVFVGGTIGTINTLRCPM